MFGNACVGGEVGGISYGHNSVSFTTYGVPDIRPGVDCTAKGKRVTCNLAEEEEEPVVRCGQVRG
jgi:hypothetical protein